MGFIREGVGDLGIPPLQSQESVCFSVDFIANITQLGGFVLINLSIYQLSGREWYNYQEGVGVVYAPDKYAPSPKESDRSNIHANMVYILGC